MKQLTIEEIIFLWSAKYKYDYKLHGYSFEDPEISATEAKKKADKLKNLYGDLI